VKEATPLTLYNDLIVGNHGSIALVGVVHAQASPHDLVAFDIYFFNSHERKTFDKHVRQFVSILGRSNGLVIIVVIVHIIHISRENIGTKIRTPMRSFNF
jgi:hypothetical membrane protein